MLVFFALVGASGSIWIVKNTAPSIFLFAWIEVTVKQFVVLGVGKLFRVDLKLLLVIVTTLCPTSFAYIALAADSVAVLLMQVPYIIPYVQLVPFV